MFLSEERKKFADIIEEAKESAVCNGICWNDPVWNITHLEHKRSHVKARLTLHFIRRKAVRSEPPHPFKQPYADFAKAFIWTRKSRKGAKHSSQRQMLIALRLLYESLLDRQISDPTKLTPRDFKITIEKAIRLHQHKGLVRIGRDLAEISKWLDAEKLCSLRINFHNPIPTPPPGDKLDPASQAEGLKKLPSNQILEILAEISNNPKDDNESIIMRIVDLLAVGGFRIGEALTIPLDCWVEESIPNRYEKSGVRLQNNEPIKRFGLRYWPEKGGDPFVKWLPDIAVPLARRAVTDLTNLCAPARKAALILEQEADRMPLSPQLNPEDLITAKQFENIIELKGEGGRSFFRDAPNLKPVSVKKNDRNQGRQYLYRVSDIEKIFIKRRGQLEVVRNPNGQTQKLSQSLCVAFRNQFHSTHPTLPFLPELISYSTIKTALGKSPASFNIFARRNLTRPDGTPLSINTHSFRHWLNTLADRGGLTDLELARWMGRKDISNNQAYKHGFVEQRVQWARDLIRAGGLSGEVSETYYAVNDPIEKQAFLETFVNAVHFTPYGVCVHDFSIEPCPHHLNCLTGCKEFLRTKGDKSERKKILELRIFTSEQLKLAQQSAARGTCGADNWVDFNRRTLAGIDSALAVDEDESSPGVDIQVFQNGKALLKPL